MALTRRGFLGGLLEAVAFDPERLLWVPGRKTIFLPPTPAVQVQVFKFGDVITVRLPQRYTIRPDDAWLASATTAARSVADHYDGLLLTGIYQGNGVTNFGTL